MLKDTKWWVSAIIVGTIIMAATYVLDLVNDRQWSPLTSFALGAGASILVDLINYFKRRPPSGGLVCLCLAAMLLGGCGKNQMIFDADEGETVVAEVHATYRYDGCQYIRINGGMTHKGNCNNPVHTYADATKK